MPSLFRLPSCNNDLVCFSGTAINPAPQVPAQEGTHLISQDPPGFEADDFDVSVGDEDAAGEVDIDDWGLEEE